MEIVKQKKPRIQFEYEYDLQFKKKKNHTTVHQMI